MTMQLDLFAPPLTQERPMTLEEAITQVLKDAGVTRAFKIRRETDGLWIVYDDDPGEPDPVDEETRAEARYLMDIANDTGG